MVKFCHLSVSEFVGWFLEQIRCEYRLCTRCWSRYWEVALSKSAVVPAVLGVYNPVGADRWKVNKQPIKY